MARSLAFGSIALAVVLGVAHATEDYRVPRDVFAGSERGPYPTGTIEELWIDPRRDETTTSDPTDKRRLMVQVWYPATVKGDPVRAPYALHRELYPHDEASRWLDAVASVRTTSVVDAPMAASRERFPVLIYNPGAEHPPFSATFQTEFQASHGYVVVAVGHSDITRIERFPDGARYSPDLGLTFLEDMASEEPFTEERFRALVQRHARTTMRIHVADLGFVLDRLRDLDADPKSRYYRRLDLQNVGALGWSFGGALSLQASRDEPRIKAAVNLDGWLYTDVPQTGTHRPILQMHGSGDGVADVGALRQQVSTIALAMSWQLYARSRAPWYDLTLLRAEHPHFSDRTLFEAPAEHLMHPRLAHDIVNRYTLEFFDEYLRARPEAQFLCGERAYPEVTLLKGGPVSPAAEVFPAADQPPRTAPAVPCAHGSSRVPK